MILLGIDSAFFLLELIVGKHDPYHNVPSFVRAMLTEDQVMQYIHSPLLRTRFTWCVPHSYHSNGWSVADLTSSQLNDVLSLCVGLWAVKVAHQKQSSKMYTYGVWRCQLLRL